MMTLGTDTKSSKNRTQKALCPFRKSPVPEMLLYGGFNRRGRVKQRRLNFEIRPTVVAAMPRLLSQAKKF